MANLLGESIIAFTLAAVSADTAAAQSDRPVKLVTQASDRQLLIRVIGQSPVDVKLRYRLVVGGEPGGGNRVDQAGAARLKGGAAPHPLATIRMSGPALGGRLLVEIEGGGGYEESFSATAE